MYVHTYIRTNRRRKVYIHPATTLDKLLNALVMKEPQYRRRCHIAVVV